MLTVLDSAALSLFQGCDFVCSFIDYVKALPAGSADEDDAREALNLIQEKANNSDATIEENVCYFASVSALTTRYVQMMLLFLSIRRV